MRLVLIKQNPTGKFRLLSNSVNQHLNVRSDSYQPLGTNLIWPMRPFNIHYSRIDNCMETKQYLNLIK